MVWKQVCLPLEPAASGFWCESFHFQQTCRVTKLHAVSSYQIDQVYKKANISFIYWLFGQLFGQHKFHLFGYLANISFIYLAILYVPSNFQEEWFLLVDTWVPWSSMLCFFPGERGMCLAWVFMKGLVGPNVDSVHVCMWVCIIDFVLQTEANEIFLVVPTD